MYYTDVFVGTGNDINNLKQALNAELKGSGLNELTQLVQGLCLFMGYPSCLCKPKKSVEESLRKISKELKEELKNYKCKFISIPKPLNLNCNSCKSDVVCKCCVLDCINEVLKSTCDCVKNSNVDCSCSIGVPKRCCKDLLEKLKACLSLLNLKADMEICSCPVDSDCCVKGECTKGSPKCDHCNNLQASKDYTVTGLGLLRPSPKRLAGRLENFFGSSPKGNPPCKCQCGTSNKSCCCLACEDTQKCAQACSCKGSSGQCPCTKKPSPCPRLTFCQNINSIKVASGSSLMRCCDSGKKCHCNLGGSAPCSGQGCCETGKKSIKCLIRRLVLYFKDLQPNPSNPDFSQNCCDLLCVAKTCEFLKMFYDKDDSKDFKKHLETLKYSSPCGHELYRTLKDFIYYCVNMVGAYVQSISGNINAAKQNCPKCPQKGQSEQHSCNNNCNGQCKGCKELLGDSHFMAILTRKFSSSYDSSNAKWDSLCSPPSCSCSHSGSCPDNGCCEKCPKRLCAKIFLGFLPCLYYGLKILYDRSQDPVTWPDWQYISVYSNGKPSSDLAKFFYAWGYGLDPLKSKKGFDIFPILGILFSSGSLNSLFETSKKYFSIHVSDSLSPPKTVRSMLLWLYGLRFQKHFSDLVLYSKSLCSPFGNSFHPDDFCYYIHTCSFILPVSIISFIETSDSALSLISSSSDWQKFSYPEDLSSLFEKLCEYARKIFVALNFLSIQCKNGPSQAGWQECFFGQNCSVSSSSVSSPSPSGCSCPNSKAYLCTGSKGHSGKCSAGSSHSSQCPHPLQAFLCHSKPNSDSESYPFGLPGITPMGFSKENLSSTARDGWSLYHVIEPFCTNGFYPLTRLLQFSLCVSRYPPETLGEFFGFFRRFRFSDVFKSHFESYVSGEPGFYSGSDLKTALEQLYGSSHPNGSSTSPHSNDLRSLYDCEGPKGSGTSHPTCGKYLFALTHNASDLFSENFVDTYVSWVCYLPKDFKTLLEKFKGKFSSCCQSSSCKKIVECPCALATLYSQGFVFSSPNSLNTNNKICSDFITQLGKVVGKGSPLQGLLDAIDAFLWSIRFPFVYAFLYIWIIVISYFYYVQFYKLDLLHIDSHLHLPRSFKILPSTLFSDASSKLKDLSYF
ncbi:variant erythrocyte surface antigen-1 family protein, partial [Babesia divergens]